MEKKENIKKEIIDGEITKFEGELPVKKSGDSGHIVLPKKLVGKKVNVSYEEK